MTAVPIPSERGDVSTSDAAFRDAMARVAAGVGVLTVRDGAGDDRGITVTSVSSVSLDPPMVLVCVKRGGSIHDAVEGSDGWALNMLADDQIMLARYAARHRRRGERDDFTAWARGRGTTGALLFTGGVAAVECAPHRFVQAGDHSVAIGRVISVPARMAGRQPLVYVDRGYRSAGEPLR